MYTYHSSRFLCLCIIFTIPKAISDFIMYLTELPEHYTFTPSIQYPYLFSSIVSDFTLVTTSTTSDFALKIKIYLDAIASLGLPLSVCLYVCPSVWNLSQIQVRTKRQTSHIDSQVNPLNQVSQVNSAVR